MSKKELSSITAINERYAMVELLVEGSFAELQRSYSFWKERGVIHIDYRMQTSLNVQRLMTAIHINELNKYIPLMTPPRTIPQINRLLQPTFEEGKLVYKHLLPRQRLEAELTHRLERLRTLKTREQTRTVKLHEQSITLTDQRALANLESYLYTFQLQWYEQILLKIINMCEAKQLHLERLLGKEWLQKLMLQLYVPMYMPKPETMNMLALQVTQATIPKLEGKSGTLYAQIITQKQAVQTKHLQANVLDRKLETKSIITLKKPKEEFPTKSTISTTEYITKNVPIPLGWAKKVEGMKAGEREERILISLLFARNIPMFVKRYIARRMGYPENIHLFQRPKISFLPTRITYGWRRKYFPTEQAITYFVRDEYIKNMQKWSSRH